MNDLSAVEDREVPGGFILSAEQIRENIRFAQRTGHSSCYFQRHTTEDGRDIITIIDLFDERWPTKSVTNDAEYTVARAVATQGNHPIVYRDTEGQWDELMHREGHFVTYRALDTRDFNEAMVRCFAFQESDAQQYGIQ